MFKVNKIKIVLATLFLLLGMKVITNSNIQKVNAASVDFQIGPVMSNKQVDKNVTYFDLKLKPKEQTNIQVQVKNMTNRTIHIDTFANTATTSDTGTVVYGKSAAKPDKSLLYQISDIATTTTPKLTLTPHATQVVTYHIQMPDKPINGLLVGGINFVERVNDIKQKTKGSMGVKNQYAFSEALVLHGQTENVKGDLKLGSVKIGQVNFRNVFKAELINPNANFINKLKINQKIYLRGSKKFLYSSKKQMMQVAPNSRFTWMTSLNGERFKSGKYRLVIDASATEGRKWHFEKNFDIQDQDASKYNDRDVTIKTDYTWLYILIGFILIMLAILVILKMRKKSQKRKSDLEALELKIKQLESDD